MVVGGGSCLVVVVVSGASVVVVVVSGASVVVVVVRGLFVVVIGISQVSPVYPWLQRHLKPPITFSQIPFLHGLG